MKYTSVITALLLLLAVQAVRAQHPRLAFPDAMIEILGPLATKSWGVVSKSGTLVDGEIVDHRSGLTRREDDSSLGGVFWRHLSKTEYGDVYLIVFEAPSGEQEAIPVLFDGRTPISATRRDWTITIKKEK